MCQKVSRLTEDDIIDVLAICIVTLHGSKLLTKVTEMATDLLKYKHLEQQLDCPLECMVAVFKAMKQDHIYCDIGRGMYKLHNFRLDYIDLADDVYFTKSEYHYVLDDDCCIFVKDYKKTWWLKEDKSE